MQVTIYKNLFKITAVVNMIGGLSAVLTMSMHLELLYGVTEVNTLLRFYHINFWIVIFAMGIGYWFLSLDPIRYRPIAILGAIGKLSISISWIIMILLGEASLLVLAGVVYDGFFGILLGWFFWKSRNLQST